MFGAAATSAPSGFTFGSPAVGSTSVPTAAVTPFGAQTTATTAAGLFGVSTPAAPGMFPLSSNMASPATTASTFQLPGAVSNPSGYQFGATRPTTGLTFGATTTIPTASAVGTAVTSASNPGYSFGQTAFQPTGSLGFGATNTAATSVAPNQTVGFSTPVATTSAQFGALSRIAPTSGSGATSNFGFGLQTLTASAPTIISTQAPVTSTFSSLIGGQSATAAIPTVPTPQSSVIGFGSNIQTQPPAFSATPSSTTSALGGSLLSIGGSTASTLTGIATPVAATSVTTTTSSLFPSAGLSFGANKQLAAPSPAATIAATTSVVTATPTTGITFGISPAAAATTSAPTTVSLLTTPLSLTTSTASSSSVVTTTSVAPTSSAVTIAGGGPGAPEAITFRKLEENINKWTLELEEQERIFLTQATQVNAWDRLLISNGDKIMQLNDALERVKLDDEHLDQEMDFILAQQRELEELLVPLEKSIESLPNLSVHQHADIEREHTFEHVENIDAQLRHMSKDLKEIIEHVNSTSGNQDANDPIYQIGKILNAHMDTLQWIDENTADLQSKVNELNSMLAQGNNRLTERI
ncbi:Nuclear pore glycoprotein p62 [Chamberlinius hualienensis]